MGIMNVRRIMKLGLGACVLVLFVTAICQAAATKESEPPVYFENIVKRLIDDGFDPKKISTIFKDPAVSFTPKKVRFLFVYSESKLNYGQFSSPKSIKKARRYLEQHQPALSKAKKKYGVEKEIITAIILVETKLGKYVGSASVFNTLSTIASLADPEPRQALWTHIRKKAPKQSRDKFEKKAIRKSAWAYAELKAFITYAAREQIDPTQLPGSLAGAIGIAQFMPSSILAYAADGNQDGRINLLEHADAIASIAR